MRIHSMELPVSPTPLDWTAVHARSYRHLRAAAARFVAWDDADDMVQEAFVRAMQGEEAFRSEAAVTTWLHRILVNACINVLRQRRRRGVHVAFDEAACDPVPTSVVDGYAIRSAWVRLSARQQTVCYLHDVAGFTHREIAQRLRIAVGTSKRTLFDARRQLRGRMAPGEA
jgi:RNA polymerase sigma-70 factor (ECF subfamily)